MNQDLTPSLVDPQEPLSLVAPAPLTPDEFDEIDTILDDVRTRFEETPQWEFCEGFMAALICCRRPIEASEYLPVLLEMNEPEHDEHGKAIAVIDPVETFASPEQAARFMELWLRRWNEVAEALNQEIEALDDDAAYQPEVMDVRGAIAALPEEERAAMADDDVPSFGQVWALGFMFAVEAWPEEWAAPRDKEAVKWLNGALDAIVALTEDDMDPPTLSVFDDDGPPSLSVKRLNTFADAVWAVYDLRELWRNFGPRVETVFKAPTPGRNDPCSCGSGKKYKKCCGA